MSTIAIGDIHGQYRALDDLLSRITPDICAQDTIVFLGDYIDRGPNSRECVERILAFRSIARGHVVTLLGNHEEWLLRTYGDYTKHSWLLGMEAFETVRSYSPAAAITLRHEAEEAGLRLITDHAPLPYEIFFDSVPKEQIEFFKNLRTFYRTPDAVCVHGGLNPEAGPVENQQPDDLIWGTDRFPDRYDGDDIVLYGHTGNPAVDKEGWPHPRIVGKTCGIDTISKGVLTALRLPENTVVQSDKYI